MVGYDIINVRTPVIQFKMLTPNDGYKHLYDLQVRYRTYIVVGHRFLIATRRFTEIILMITHKPNPPASYKV